MNPIVNEGVKVLAARKPNTAERAALGAVIGGVLGAMIAGPVWAAILAGLFGGYGAYSGAVEDEKTAR